MIRLTRTGLVFFSKITPELFPALQQRLQQTKQLSTLGEYYSPQNLQSLFDLVLATKLTHSEANRALDSLFPFCTTDNDHQINLLANILKQKAINDARRGDVPNAISNFQQAISTILLMENPNQLALSQIYKFVADLCVQINELKKAEQSLKQAENIILSLEAEESEDQRTIDAGLACIYSQLCMIKYRERRPMDALQELKRSLDRWDRVPTKILQEYELTCRLKCMLHLLFKEEREAVTTARQFLQFMFQSPEYKKLGAGKTSFILTKLYFMNIVCVSEEAPEFQDEVVRLLKEFQAERGEEKLTELMIMVGIKPDRYAI